MPCFYTLSSGLGLVSFSTSGCSWLALQSFSTQCIPCLYSHYSTNSPRFQKANSKIRLNFYVSESNFHWVVQNLIQGKIFVIDGSKRSSHSNAYFYGLFTDKTIVVYDTLLEQSSNDEIVAIIGHELGHWHMNHQWKRLLAVQVHMFALFYVFSLCINLDSLYTSFGFDSKPTFIGFVLFQVNSSTNRVYLLPR